MGLIFSFRKLYFLFLLILLYLLLGCNNNRGSYIASQRGISLDTLDLIYFGPDNFTLVYFPKKAIRAARIRECEIVQSDSTNSIIARRVQFDENGHILRDEYNFFDYWFEGTARGRYNYQDNDKGQMIKMKGIHQENSKDSTLTIWNYNPNGLLYSKDEYEFAKKLKPDADRHAPGPSDFEKYPTWNKKETFRFSHILDTIMIETLVEDKPVEIEKYQLFFDSLKRVKAVKKFEHGSLAESNDYTYGPNDITCLVRRTRYDGTTWTYKSKAVLNDKGWQIEKIILNDNGSEKVKMIIAYNDNGTIRSIKYNNNVQEFRYSYH